MCIYFIFLINNLFTVKVKEIIRASVEKQGGNREKTCMKSDRYIKYIFLIFCILFFSSTPCLEEDLPSSCDCHSELSLINTQIAYLEKVKTRYLALALIHEEQAMRWQFDPHLKQEAKRSLQLADSERRVVQEIQDYIDDLCMRRDKILKTS
jgi:hypothetical protein